MVCCYYVDMRKNWRVGDTKEITRKKPQLEIALRERQSNGIRRKQTRQILAYVSTQYPLLAAPFLYYIRFLSANMRHGAHSFHRHCYFYYYYYYYYYFGLLFLLAGQAAAFFLYFTVLVHIFTLPSPPSSIHSVFRQFATLVDTLPDEGNVLLLQKVVFSSIQSYNYFCFSLFCICLEKGNDLVFEIQSSLSHGYERSNVDQHFHRYHHSKI